MDYTAVGIHDFYTFLLVLARVSGLVGTAPLLSSTSVPRTARVGFALVFSLALVPMAASKSGPVPTSLLVLVSCVLKDALFGMSLGFLARLLFSAVEMAGFFSDTQMGFGMMSILNPFSPQQSSVMSAFQYQLTMTLWLAAGGHLMLLGALADSFRLLPPGTVSPNAAFGESIIPMIRMMFVIGFRLALPVAGVIIVLDVAFGLLARMVPQLNIMIVGQPAKILVGLATIALILPVLGSVVTQIMGGTNEAFHLLLKGSH